MSSDLTSNPNASELEEVTVMGRTVYVSESSEEAYVEFRDEFVSMTDLRAWNTLMERAKQEAIPHYDDGQSLAEKELEREAKSVADRMRDQAHELHRVADEIQRCVGDVDE